jgi:hypothetical protein
MEDYNTATLPHPKYYSYEKWEELDYEKKKQKVRFPFFLFSVLLCFI